MTTQRSFILGDHWLYLKIYTGFKTSDLLLTEVIYPLTQKLMAENNISHWFFIRYADPQTHLRIRFYLPNVDRVGIVIMQIKSCLQSMFDEELIWRIQYDTYNRELERYGNDTIIASEELFHHDSIMVSEIIKRLYGHGGDVIRWLLALRMIDSLLNDFNYSLSEKHSLLYSLRESFGKEFNITTEYRKQLGKSYRANRQDIERVLTIKIGSDDEMSPLLEPIENKSYKIGHVINFILTLGANQSLEISLRDVISSHVHMMLNRLFRTKQRMHELIIYDHLFSYYDSIVRRDR